MINPNTQFQFYWKTFIFSPLLILSFLFSQLEAKAQVKESDITTEASNFENKLKGIDDAEHFIINGKKLDKKQLV